MKTIIFTDLDGTLLHPETYSFEAAEPALNAIRARDIPLVLCSSKTRVEMELYRERLQNNHPFITENGGGIFVPKGYFPFSPEEEQKGNYIVTAYGMPYKDIRRELMELRKRLEVPVIGFGDMTVEEVANRTGLPPAEAVLARARDFSEPFVFELGIEDEGFFKAIKERGLHWTRGRLYCLMGEHDKGKAVRLLKKLYEKEHGRIITIGLGDALNDLSLLQEADYPILIQKHDGSYDPKIRMPDLIMAQGIGPEGWNNAVLALLNT